MYYYALGNELNLDKFNMFLDFMYSHEDIDRNGTITGIVDVRTVIMLLMPDTSLL